MHRLVPPMLVCCAGALLLGGCHRHEGAPVEPTARAAPVARPAATGPAAPATVAPKAAASAAKPVAPANDAFRVASLTLGSAIDAGYAVTAPTTRFAPDTSIIYASVATAGRTASATLDAHWRYLEGKGVLVNELSQVVAADGPAVTTFKVQNPNRWPAGKYRVEVSLDGKPVAQQDFEVTAK